MSYSFVLLIFAVLHTLLLLFRGLITEIYCNTSVSSEPMINVPICYSECVASSYTLCSLVELCIM